MRHETKNTDRYGINKQNTTTHSEKDNNWKGLVSMKISDKVIDYPPSPPPPFLKQFPYFLNLSLFMEKI